MDMETCSWCCEEVPYSTLTESLERDGAMVCRACKKEQRELLEEAREDFEERIQRGEPLYLNYLPKQRW